MGVLVKFRVSVVMLSVAIILGYIFVLFRYYNYLSRIQFIALTGVVVLLLPSLILISQDRYSKSMFPKINLERVKWGLPLLVFLSAFIETWFLGHMGFLTVIMLSKNAFSYSGKSTKSATVSARELKLFVTIFDLLFNSFLNSLL